MIPNGQHSLKLVFLRSPSAEYKFSLDLQMTEGSLKGHCEIWHPFWDIVRYGILSGSLRNNDPERKPCVVYAQEAMYFCFRISPLLAFKKSNAAQPQAELSCHDNSYTVRSGILFGTPLNISSFLSLKKSDAAQPQAERSCHDN